MSIEEILSLYDQQMRFGLEPPGMRREAGPHAVRLVDLMGHEGSVIYSSLNEGQADQVIQEQVDYFRCLAQPFEWKWFSHDQPPDLPERLRGHGFKPGTVDSIMVLDLAEGELASRSAPGFPVERVDSPLDIRRALEVQETVEGVDLTWLADRLCRDVEADPGGLSVYRICQGGRPVASAWIYFHAGTGFASLWGGSTLEDYRRRGCYSALLAVRANEARERGFLHLTIDAGPMSRPIVEKHRFRRLTTAQEFKWRPDRDEPERISGRRR